MVRLSSSGRQPMLQHFIKIMLCCLRRPYSHEDERHALHEPMPLPMFPNNYAPSTRCCAYQDELKKYVVSHEG